MYAEHFNLRELPFGLTPDTQFFLNTRGHRDALNMMMVALAEGEGFIKVVGEVGTGKTMLCRELLSRLDDSYFTAYIPNPFLSSGGLFRTLADELDIKIRTRDGISELLSKINRRLVELVAAGQKVVLVIDEAQAIPPKTMEALRLISNLETEKNKLIHIVLLGQPELDVLLDQDSLRQVRQRIIFSCLLPVMDRESTEHYIEHRLAMAGYNDKKLFSGKVHRMIFTASGGVPRLVNILCHKALMCAYGKGAKTVSSKHMDAAISDTEGVRTAETPYTEHSDQKSWLVGMSLAAATLTTVATVVVRFWQ